MIALIEQAAQATDVNRQIMDILQETVNVYDPRDNTEIMKAVEATELSPDQKLAIRDISFHSILLVPWRIEPAEQWIFSPVQMKSLVAALGM